ncbi:choline transporter-like 2 isoform X2 [Rhodnius prolixus]
MMANDDEETTSHYGAPLKYDPEFQGPKRRRSCTDIIFLILFIVFLVAWAFIAFYAFKNGSLSKLFNPVDSQGRRCGEDSEVIDKKYLFFFDLSKCASPKVLLNGCDTPQICVEGCPKISWSSKPYIQGAKQFNLNDVQENLICVDENVKKSINTLEKLKASVDDGHCADWYISSSPVNYFCLPSHEDLSSSYQFLEDTGLPFALEVITNSTEHITTFSINEIGTKVLDDLLKTWRHIVIALIVTIVVSLVYIILLRWIAGIMTWLSLLAVLALMLTGAVYCVKRYIYLRDNEPTPVTGKMLKGELENLANVKELWLALTIILGILLLIALILIIFLRKRIAIAITLIKEGSKAVCSVLSSLFFPLIPWCLKCGVVIWVLFIAFHLFSIGTQIYKAYGMDVMCKCNDKYENLNNGDICDPKLFQQWCHNQNSPGAPCTSAGCRFYKMESDSVITYLHLFNAFGFFWGIWFVSGLSDLILAGTFAKWYWTFDKRRVPFFAVTEATARTLRYHLGTVALGSLIISICSFIRAIIEYTEKKVKAYENSIMKAFFCCLKCFFWCLEKFLRFINKNAYIMCAIHGRNFCISAKDAFNLLMRNFLRVVVLDKVTDFLFFIGKVVITGVVVAGAYFLVFQRNTLNLHFEGAVPLLAIAVCSYLIAATFFGVYSMAVDTLFLCFLEDCERNDGSVERPYFMSKNLRQILGKRNKEQN